MPPLPGKICAGADCIATTTKIWKGELSAQPWHCSREVITTCLLTVQGSQHHCSSHLLTNFLYSEGLFFMAEHRIRSTCGLEVYKVWYREIDWLLDLHSTVATSSHFAMDENRRSKVYFKTVWNSLYRCCSYHDAFKLNQFIFNFTHILRCF